MYQFFVEATSVHDKDITITGSDVNHIKNVLRMKVGQELYVVTEQNNKEYCCEIREFGPDCVICDIRFIKEDNVELPNDIYLFQGLPKADKMEFIIQKAVELGVTGIIPVATTRSVVKLDKKRAAAKVDRWNLISEAAAKQSKRRIIPKISEVMTMKEALEYARDIRVKLMPYELTDMDSMQRTRELLSNIKPGEGVAIFIGPEGGFTDEEVGLATETGFEAITLGRRILRTETAGMTVLSWLVFLTEE